MKKKIYLWVGMAFLFIRWPPVNAAAIEALVVSVEEESEHSRSLLREFDLALSLSDRKTLKETSLQAASRLSPRLRELHRRRWDLKKKMEFWETASELKKSLLDLPRGERNDVRDESKQVREADAVARAAIEEFGRLREKYDMIRPAALHNFMVNVGMKREGLCWQWTRDLMERLKGLDLKTLDLLWATAREGTFREHNVPVVVSKGRDLQDGLLLDGWKHSGKPYWIRVTKDDHPWKMGQYYGDE